MKITPDFCLFDRRINEKAKQHFAIKSSEIKMNEVNKAFLRPWQDAPSIETHTEICQISVLSVTDIFKFFIMKRYLTRWIYSNKRRGNV